MVIAVRVRIIVLRVRIAAVMVRITALRVRITALRVRMNRSFGSLFATGAADRKLKIWQLTAAHRLRLVQARATRLSRGRNGGDATPCWR
jgi:hypothetical protein